jgi:hypothetical protein
VYRNRRRELAKFVLDLARVVFGGTVVARVVGSAGVTMGTVMLVTVSTAVLLVVGLVLVPEGD